MTVSAKKLALPACSAHQAGSAEYHDAIFDRRIGTERVIFDRNSQFSAENSVTAEWPKLANNAENVSAENSPKFRPNLSAVSPFGRTLDFGD